MARSKTDFVILHENFNRQLKKVADKLDKEEGEKFLKELALALLEEVIPATPVDQGRARAGWLPAARRLGAPTSGSKPIAGKAEGTISISKKKIIIVNSVPYIVRLEFGWSPQNTRGILRPAIRKLTRTLRDMAEKLPDRIV